MSLAIILFTIHYSFRLACLENIRNNLSVAQFKNDEFDYKSGNSLNMAIECLQSKIIIVNSSKSPVLLYLVLNWHQHTIQSFQQP